MMKQIATVCLLAFVTIPSNERFRKYSVPEVYETSSGIMIKPFYTSNHDVCEISIERRHLSNGIVDFDATMSKEQIMTLFDELVSTEERGHPGNKKLIGDTQITEIDSNALTVSILYENVTLAMYGFLDHPKRQKDEVPKNQKYLAAIISWNNLECEKAGGPSAKIEKQVSLMNRLSQGRVARVPGLKYEVWKFVTRRVHHDDETNCYGLFACFCHYSFERKISKIFRS